MQPNFYLNVLPKGTAWQVVHCVFPLVKMKEVGSGQVIVADRTKEEAVRIARELETENDMVQIEGEDAMTLEDAFAGNLTSSIKGLQKAVTDISKLGGGIKKATEKGDLAALKKKLADLRGIVGELEKKVAGWEARATQLAPDQNGKIVDLSVTADRRF